MLVTCVECQTRVPIEEIRAHSLALHGPMAMVEDELEHARRRPGRGADSPPGKLEPDPRFSPTVKEWTEWLHRIGTATAGMLGAVAAGDDRDILAALCTLRVALLATTEVCQRQIDELERRLEPVSERKLEEPLDIGKT